jgi:hypothetical protein
VVGGDGKAGAGGVEGKSGRCAVSSLGPPAAAIPAAMAGKIFHMPARPTQRGRPARGAPGANHSVSWNRMQGSIGQIGMCPVELPCPPPPPQSERRWLARYSTCQPGQHSGGGLRAVRLSATNKPLYELESPAGLHWQTGLCAVEPLWRLRAFRDPVKPVCLCRALLGTHSLPLQADALQTARRSGKTKRIHSALAAFVSQGCVQLHLCLLP